MLWVKLDSCLEFLAGLKSIRRDVGDGKLGEGRSRSYRGYTEDRVESGGDGPAELARSGLLPAGAREIIGSSGSLGNGGTF